MPGPELRGWRIVVTLGLLLAACTITPQAVQEAGTATTSQVGEIPSEEVYRRVSPAIAFVETELGSGSAVLFDDRHALTNAHVVWPFEEARVVFPDGIGVQEARVIAWDLIGDLAVLDLSEAIRLPDPVEQGSVEGLEVGDDLYLVGYPSESDMFPVPTLSRGLLSRIRSWDEAGLTYLQTDAAIAGGQSGGALVDGKGRVVGLSGLELDGFGLALSSTDAFSRAERLLGGEDLDGLGTRLLPADTEGSTQQQASTAHFVDQLAWIVWAEAGDSLEVTAVSDGDLAVRLVSPDGWLDETVDDGSEGSETGTVWLDTPGPHTVLVDVFSDAPSDVRVTADLKLVSFSDLDHGRVLTVGSTTAANADFPGDVDWFYLDLVEGQSVRISVTSTIMDPAVYLDLPGEPGEPLAHDDDSGRGIGGLDAELTFTAADELRYLLSVADVGVSGPGAYLITVTDEDRPGP